MFNGIINLAKTSVNTTGYWVYDKFAAAGQTLHQSSGDDSGDREEKNFKNYLEKLSLKLLSRDLSPEELKSRLEKLAKHAVTEKIKPDKFSKELIGSDGQSGILNLCYGKNASLPPSSSHSSSSSYQAIALEAVKRYQKNYSAIQKVTRANHSTTKDFGYWFLLALMMVGAAEAIVVPAGLPNVRRLPRNSESLGGDSLSFSTRDAVNNKPTPEDYGMVLLAKGAVLYSNNTGELPPPSLFNSPTGEWGVTYFRQNDSSTYLVAKTFNVAGEAISQDEFFIFDLSRYAALSATAGEYINRAVGISNEQFAIVYVAENTYQFNLQVQSMTGLQMMCSTTINANPNTASGYLYDFDLVSLASNNDTKIAVITTWNEKNLFYDYKKDLKPILDVYIQLYSINCIQIASINTPVATNAAAISQINNLVGNAGLYQSALSLPVTNQNNILFAYLSSFHFLEGTYSYTTYLITFDTSTNNFTVNNGPIVYSPNTSRYYIQRLTYVNLDQFDNIVNCLELPIAQRTQCFINPRSSTVAMLGFYSTDLLLKTIFFSDNSALLFNTDQFSIYTSYMQIEKHIDNITHHEQYVGYTMPSALSPLQGSIVFSEAIFDAVALTKANFVYIEAMGKKLKNGSYTFIDIYYKISSALLTFNKSALSTLNYTESQITPINGISISVIYNSAITITAALSSEFGIIQSIANSPTALSFYNPSDNTWVAGGDQFGLNTILAGLTFKSATGFYEDINITFVASDNFSPTVNFTINLHGTPAPKTTAGTSFDAKYIGIAIGALSAVLIGATLAYLEMRRYQKNNEREKNNAFVNHIYNACRFIGADDVKSDKWKQFVSRIEEIEQSVKSGDISFVPPDTSNAPQDLSDGIALLARQAKEQGSFTEDEDRQSGAPRKNAIVESSIVHAIDDAANAKLIKTTSPLFYPHFPYARFFREFRILKNPFDLSRNMTDISASAHAFIQIREKASLSEPKNAEQDAYKDSIALDSLKAPMLVSP